MMLPRLHTARLVLRPATPGDADRLWRLWTDPEVRRYLWDDRVIEAEEARAMLDSLLAAAGRGLGLWTLWPRDEGGFAGHCGLRPLADAAAAEVVMALAPAAWHRGYASEALHAMRDHAFGTLGLARLEGVADEPNRASQRLLERMGFGYVRTGPGPRFPLRHYELRAPVVS